MTKQDLTLAVNSFKRVIYDKAFSDKVLSAYEGNIESKNFVKYALFGTLRDFYFIENFIVPKFLEKRKYKKSDKFLISAIFVALFLAKDSRKKDYAIVNMMVDIVKKEVNEGASKLFNGVVRNVIREGLYPRDIEKMCETSEFYKKIKRDHPKKYIKVIENLLFSDIRIGGFFRDDTKNEAYEVSPFSNEYYYIKSDQMKDIEDTFVFQDLANHLLMKSFKEYITEDKTSVEVSAYPGGKSFYINKGKTFHCDVLPWKVKALKERLENIVSKDASFLVSDGSALPFKDDSIDNIFIDVPCSGSGIVKKKPEITINFTEENMRDTIKLQREILHEASRVVKVGGRIFYSTCTIFNGENESQIKKFLSKHKNFILDTKYSAPISVGGYYSSIDELNNMDGIFGTILQKKD